MISFVCQECNQVFEKITSLARHIKIHNISYEFYNLKYKYNFIRPICKCGCNQETNWNIAKVDFCDYIQGHNALGKQRTEEEKIKIGFKNSVNMKNYHILHPELAQEKSKQLRQAFIDDPALDIRRIEATKLAYKNMTKEDKQKFVDHTKNLWETGILGPTQKKAQATWKQRYENGEYDFTKRNEKLSIAITNYYLDGGQPWSKGYYISIKTGIKSYYRSSWEFKLMNIFDKDQEIIEWKYEPFALNYQINGINHRYIPDFLVIKNQRKELIEVKPIALRETIENEAKRNSALNYCKNNNIFYLEWDPNNLYKEY